MMGGMNIEFFISTLLTLCSLLFAVLSWWSANRSKQARQSAELAAAQAAQELEAVKSQADSLVKLASSFWRPVLELEPVDHYAYRLTNKSERAVCITEALNRAKFQRFGFELPLQLLPGEAVEALLGGNHQYPAPVTVFFVVEGRGDPVAVALPRYQPPPSPQPLNLGLL